MISHGAAGLRGAKRHLVLIAVATIRHEPDACKAQFADASPAIDGRLAFLTSHRAESGGGQRLGGPVETEAAKAEPVKTDIKRPVERHRGPLNGQTPPARAATARRATAALPVCAPQSAELRDRLLAELAEVSSDDAMAGWAHRSLSAKNRLSVTDAQLVETGFRDKLAIVSEGGLDDDNAESPGESIQKACVITADPEAGIRSEERVQHATAASAAPRRGGSIQAKTIRLRDKEHRNFVAMQPCLVCGRTPADPHHLRFAQPRAMSRKVSDEFTVPVCRLHHRELLAHGDEKLFWKRINIDPLPIALRLWKQGRPDRSVIRPTRKTQFSQNGPVNEVGGVPEVTVNRADGGTAP